MRQLETPGAHVRRVAAARRFFRLLCVLWVLLVPVGQLFRAPYLRLPWHDATWTLSAGALALAWVGTALWSGVVLLGYRGIGSRAVARAEAPRAFWGHLAIGGLVGVALIVFGLMRLPHPAWPM